MKNNFIKTEGYPKWIYINKFCREIDKRIAIGEIPNSKNRFIFISYNSEEEFLSKGNIDECYLSEIGIDVSNEKPIFPVNKNRTIEDGLEVNDIIVDNDGDECKILAVLNEENQVYALSVYNNFSEFKDIQTLKELIYNGYKLKSQVDSDAVEMTVEEISKQLGKNIKIVKG